MSKAFWQAKIWGLLHDPALKALRTSGNFGDEGCWQSLNCMQGWASPKEATSDTELNGTWLEYVGRCDLIASASDRSTIGRLPAQYSGVSYGDKGLDIHHLLSGERLSLKFETWHEQIMHGDRKRLIKQQEIDIIPEIICTCPDPRKVFWWFWRCYPEVLARQIPEIHLLPAETRLPDGSLWSHTSITAALAGSLAGYYKKPEDYPKKGKTFKRSRPHIATLTFTPIQEMIRASRKMRDLWAGSWLLHYLSAKVCWDVAWKYGPDTMVYPCLYAQPLIDHWLLQKYPEFSEWIDSPAETSLLTAGFPNVLVMVLPDNGVDADAEKGSPVRAAMQQIEQKLQTTWQELGDHVLNWLKKEIPDWNSIHQPLWDSWLQSQWQSYWVALPLGDRESELHHSPRKTEEFNNWVAKQNKFSQPIDDLFLEPEEVFIKTIFGLTENADGDNLTQVALSNLSFKQPNFNVGSWWASIFDQIRASLTAVKNARPWQMPTVFGPRSTISGVGPVLHPVYDENKPDWANEGQTHDFWENPAKLFDGIEELNATEVVKRGLHQILRDVLEINDSESEGGKIRILYPDLSSGVAGWLKTLEKQGDDLAKQHIERYKKTCQTITQEFTWTQPVMKERWGIPWADDRSQRHYPNPRLLSPSWLIEEFPEQDANRRKTELANLKKTTLDFYPPGNNPTDWYVLAQGDGDSMSDWLKGKNMAIYDKYIPDALRIKLDRLSDSPFKEAIYQFLKVKKRMGPASHSALSRALLDFSNQLVPYLTEQRYAGRLIYSGGDDILAYTNLWEWDHWLWDIRQCFQGQADPEDKFDDKGDYWRWKGNDVPKNLSKRPLFTMGRKATISFGITIVNSSVPLAIALENLREAEKAAKQHRESGLQRTKDAVQVRILYGNGNILTATTKFEIFNHWKLLLEFPNMYPHVKFDPALFEQAAQTWNAHPVPHPNAILPWTQAFCDRRELFKSHPDEKEVFIIVFSEWLKVMYTRTLLEDCDREIQNWLKLAAFVLRKRNINLGDSK